MLASWPWHSIPWQVRSSPKSCLPQASRLCCENGPVCTSPIFLLFHFPLLNDRENRGMDKLILPESLTLPLRELGEYAILQRGLGERLSLEKEWYAEQQI